MIKLTYIVCVYNSASTIIDTLNSIYSQPLPENEYEVIVVDDCSPDNSSELVKDFAGEHSNLTLVCQKENHRVGTSMNVGIRLAKGEYIQVVDGDDVVGNGIIDTLNLCLSEKVDASINDCYSFSADDSKEFWNIHTNLSFPMSGYDFCEKVFSGDPIFGGTQFYMWRREFLLEVNHPFVEDLKFEDTDWIEYHLYYAKKIGHGEYDTYHYLYNENSQLHQLSISSVADRILQSYRRLKGAEIFRTERPRYANSIIEGSLFCINSILRYKTFTKFSCGEYRYLYDKLGTAVRADLISCQLGFMAYMFLKHKYLTLIFLDCTTWLPRILRMIVHRFGN